MWIGKTNNEKISYNINGKPQSGSRRLCSEGTFFFMRPTWRVKRRRPMSRVGEIMPERKVNSVTTRANL